MAIEATAAPPTTAAAPAAATVQRAHQSSVGDSILRGALALLSTQPLTWAASLLGATFIPRLLGAQALGEFTLAISITGLASTALGLGISEFLTRRIAQQPQTIRTDVGLAMFIQTSAAALGALVILAISPFLSAEALNLPLLYIALFGLVTGPAQFNLLASFRGREKHAGYAWANALQAVVSTVGGVVALLLGGGVLAFAIATVGCSALSTLVGWKFVGFVPSLPKFDSRLYADVRQFLRGGFPFLSWNLTLYLYGMNDRIMLGFFVPAEQIGWYTAAARIVGVTVFIPTVISAPLLPVLSRSVHDPATLRRALAQTLRISLLLMVPLAAGIIAVAPAVPQLLGWPDDFASAIPLMRLMSLHLPLIAVDMVLASVIMAIGHESRWVRVGLLAAVFNIGGNLVLIPLCDHAFGNGAIGSAIVTVSTEILMFVGAMVVLPRHFLDPKIAWFAVRIALAGVATAIVGAALVSMSLILAVIGGAVAYGITVVVLRVLDLEDLRFVTRRLTARRGSPPTDANA